MPCRATPRRLEPPIRISSRSGKTPTPISPSSALPSPSTQNPEGDRLGRIPDLADCLEVAGLCRFSWKGKEGAFRWPEFLARVHAEAIAGAIPGGGSACPVAQTIMSVRALHRLKTIQKEKVRQSTNPSGQTDHY